MTEELTIYFLSLTLGQDKRQRQAWHRLLSLNTAKVENVVVQHYFTLLTKHYCGIQREAKFYPITLEIINTS